MSIFALLVSLYRKLISYDLHIRYTDGDLLDVNCA